MAKFDYSGARAAGWSDKDISSYLTKRQSEGSDLYIDKEEYEALQPAKQPGFLASVAKSIIKPFAEVGTSVLNVGESVVDLARGDVAGASEALKKERNVPLLGETKPAFTGEETTGEATKKMLGYGAEIGSWFVGGGGVKAVAGSTLKGVVKTGAVQGLKAGAIGGGLAAGGRAVQEDKSFGEVAKEAALGTVTGAALGSAIGAAAPAIVKGVKGVLKPIGQKIDDTVKEAIDKGIKPYFAGVKTPAKSEEYYARAAQAFRTIKKYAPEITGEDEMKVVKSPSNRRELLEAIGGAKQKIYSAYHGVAVDAGEQGAKYNPKNVLGKLDEVAASKKYNPEVRSYADSLKAQIQELEGEAPDIIEARIQDLNSSLAGFYEGRVNKAKAQVDASVAALMRDELDNLIEGTTGAEYQAIKNEYGALKTIEKDVARQVFLEARKNPKGLIDFTDIFSGGDLISGVLTANPALIVRGAAARGIKEWIKALNNPNRYIKKAFDLIDKTEVSSKLPKAKAQLDGLKIPGTPSGPEGTAVKAGGATKGQSLADDKAVEVISPKRKEFLKRYDVGKNDLTDNNLIQYYADIKKQEPYFVGAIEDIANGFGGEYVYRMKSWASIGVKMGRRPDNFRLAKIDDAFGSTVLTDDIDGALKYAEKKYKVTNVDDFRAKPTFLGYKAVHLDVELPNGQIGEIQLNTKQGLYQKSEGHKTYDKWRKYIESAQGSTFDDIKAKIPKDQLDEFTVDVEYSNGIFNGTIPVPKQNISMVNADIRRVK